MNLNKEETLLKVRICQLLICSQVIFGDWFHDLGVADLSLAHLAS